MTTEQNDNQPEEPAGFAGKELAAELVVESQVHETNLDPDLARLVQTEDFRRWYGAGKLNDEHGDPQVYYHGGAAAINGFSREAPRNTGPDQLGYYFTRIVI